MLDQVLFSVGIARTTYVSKIAAKKEDVTATLSLGVTVDHVISMSIPTLGGLIWAIYGYQYVFIGAAIVACLTLIATGFITIPPPKTENQIETEAAG